MHPLARYLDPRRSLASALGWLVFVLSIGLALIASLWVGEMVGTNLLDLRSRQLVRAADDIAGELNLALVLRLHSVRTMAAILAKEFGHGNQTILRKTLEDLQRASPEFAWIGVANVQGRVLAATHGELEGASVADRSWFALSRKESLISDMRLAPIVENAPTAAIIGVPGAFIELVAKVIDSKEDVIGVIGVHLSKSWLLDLAVHRSEKLRVVNHTEALLLDQESTVLIGPENLNGKHWENFLDSTHSPALIAARDAPSGSVESFSRVERMADGRRLLVAHANSADSPALRDIGWRVAVFQPFEDATQPSTILQVQITAVLLGLGLLAALLGVVLTRRVMRGLKAIARSADGIRTGATQNIVIPSGQNEAARLGHVLENLLMSLQRERSELQTLNAELEKRVLARTREIERLAIEARHAAVGRERLNIARDLHDTLAHSMMAMLTEIRLLKRLSALNPSAMAEELARAEETAQQGLKEARESIAQMRYNPVRDSGLASVLEDFAKLFCERTGIVVDFMSDAQAGAFADERAETLFRMLQEAMRNVERHAGATRISISMHELDDGRGLMLTIADNGVGFDTQAPHPGHYGLAGLHEQAQLIGATLTVVSAPQQGTTISIALTPEVDT